MSSRRFRVRLCMRGQVPMEERPVSFSGKGLLSAIHGQIQPVASWRKNTAIEAQVLLVRIPYIWNETRNP